jgi:hypothetical protein
MHAWRCVVSYSVVAEILVHLNEGQIKIKHNPAFSYTSGNLFLHAIRDSVTHVMIILDCSVKLQARLYFYCLYFECFSAALRKTFALYVQIGFYIITRIGESYLSSIY